MDQNCHDQNQAYRWMIEMFDYSYYFRQNHLSIDQSFGNRQFVDDFQMQHDFPIIGSFQQLLLLRIHVVLADYHKNEFGYVQ